ncbi:NifU family protein [Nonomuraea diastatica]|uniref:NifU family protein n=1 Tax=Nonomuraea diastatica TaxID=1848329 RepID=A0A4R4WZJ4_9ACTN|nr:NifU family protein [Nonomuraea diastatica]TDD23258.1 NifU family protein [Nonomuraea diastatica]
MDDRIARIEVMLDGAGPDAVELVKELLGLYGEGLARVMAILEDEQAARLAADESVAPLLLLHDLHPLDVRARVEAAISGSAELLAVEDDLVRLRVRPAGCRSSATAASALREAVRAAAPEIEHVDIEVEREETPLIPVESLAARSGPRTP